MTENLDTSPELAIRSGKPGDATTLPHVAAATNPAGHLVIPGYEIVEILGRGGMGIVYKGWQQSLQRFVALKIVSTGAQASPEQVTRFRIETESVGQLHHPHIVQIYEVGEHNGCPYCSLEFVEGGTLAQKLNGKPVAPQEAAQLTEKLARAIEAAHQRGIVHRDLKPSNVMLTADGQPKVTDFGLAKRMNSDIIQTLSGAVVGTPEYMAPEQASGKKEVGPAADVYGLGAILYELLTGRPPFRAETPLDTVLRVLSEEPVPPRRLEPRVPRDLETICLKCLEKEPRRRYASADALGDDLLRHQRGETIAARPPGLLGRFDRWARLRPALAVTLVALAFFYLNHLVLLGMGTPGEGGDFHWFVTGVAAFWACGAVGFQWLVSRTRWIIPATFGWVGFDVFMLTLFLLKGDGPRSALLVGFLLLIAGTTLRFRSALLWYVVGLCLVSYLGLLAEASWRRPELMVQPKDVIIFSLSLGLLGLIQHFLLRRVRAATTSDR